ncbi:10702_t:CDS:2, partial [Gigaspora rosea]
MIKLNSFVKESLRFITPIVGLPHKCHLLMDINSKCINFCDTNNDEELQGQNPTEFHAYHYLECNSPATKLECRKLACPGRTFAVNQIKIFIHKILKYVVRTNNEEIEPKRRYLGPFPLPVK